LCDEHYPIHLADTHHLGVAKVMASTNGSSSTVSHSTVSTVDSLFESQLSWRRERQSAEAREGG